MANNYLDAAAGPRDSKLKNSHFFLELSALPLRSLRLCVCRICAPYFYRRDPESAEVAQRIITFRQAICLFISRGLRSAKRCELALALGKRYKVLIN